MKKRPLLTFSDVSFSYPSHEVFRTISLKVFPGEFIGVIGPNGCGKSTLFKLILNLINPSSGTIQLENSQPFIGYVPQHTHHDPLFPASVLEMIIMGAACRINWRRSNLKDIKATAHDWLERFGLTKHAHRPYNALSGGQMQKVLLIRALILDPDLLLLDEPTNHVDNASASFILNFLKSLTKTKTILMIMHDFDAIVNNVDRILSVQKNIVSLEPSQVCHHFAMGLYHDKKDLK
ncbi:zinc ABC transporter ATP-binding protein [Candidatus Aerophobetes bacterium]|uniref:Zinc ABC transporter ATP-binding protein n=1 Tax=Aerophobetes bacterium TaxID=2030807 RepID=A0A2A4X0D3_UNCAE|nr:MAG: zinc ABC transporter ATP-binding protein [Candidatus Aerophobetes bacterium]